jgi:GDP/UDP-N,N'-diacetylbacillosamine 2-epimerase (hydrolysing)
MSRKVCVVTGSRAEYGLLRWVMEGIRDSGDLELQVVATGTHLSPEHGLTYREIEEDGFRIDHKVEMLLSADTPSGIVKSTGLAMIGFADVLAQLDPDIVLVLGDRFEILAAATAALISKIPLAHVHGGEASEGVIDEAIRHSVTKMAHLHFVAAEAYRQRVIQLGEQPDRVFTVGGLGVDAIQKVKLLERERVEDLLEFAFRKRNLLVTFHPVSLETNTMVGQTRELLEALRTLDETGLIFTMPNADTDSRGITELIRSFVRQHPNAKAFTSLGQDLYLSALAQVDAVVGNSSSGLLEAPTFGKGTINIGDRQRGRLRADSVIDCAPRTPEIKAAIDRLYSADFQNTLSTVVSPYGEGGASDRIVRHLAEVPVQDILKKRFYDISVQ